MGSAAGVQVIRWCGQQARTGPWRGDRDVAYLSPLAGGSAPSVAFVHRCLDQLAADGFTRVVTTALGPLEQPGFLAAGFRVQERLRVLTHDLGRLPPAAPPHRGEWRMRACRPADVEAVLVVDHLAFADFWRLDRSGLDDAVSATPRVRFNVAWQPETDQVIGYAVTGRAGRRGFLQRLAVHPDHQGAGVGRALVLDGLRWLRRWRAEQAVVNTQLDNSAALALYQSVGFYQEPPGLLVLSAGLRP